MNILEYGTAFNPSGEIELLQLKPLENNDFGEPVLDGYFDNAKPVYMTIDFHRLLSHDEYRTLYDICRKWNLFHVDDVEKCIEEDLKYKGGGWNIKCPSLTDAVAAMKEIGLEGMTAPDAWTVRIYSEPMPRFKDWLAKKEQERDIS